MNGFVRNQSDCRLDEVEHESLFVKQRLLTALTLIGSD